MPISPDHMPELLAPAGGPEALRAAVAAGADAIYVGVGTLNARQGAQNFDLASLEDACRYAHLRGRKVYLTANVVILPDELADALSLIDQAWAVGVDAVIVQDLGLLRAIREALPQVRIHVSTQVNVHSSRSIEALADSGISRVTLARETSLPEIKKLVATGSALGIEVESFVHGAICVCYSGQCLMSSLIGQRSANRGLCAQPCRLPYELIDEANSVLASPGAHLLSPKDLAGITMLPKFIDAGVASLKIEGRMKSPEYVALVTGVYREALDRAAAQSQDYQVRDGELSVLNEAFSRGFSEAYLVGERGNDMMSYRRPNNRGVQVGRVVSVDGKAALVALEIELDADDTIEVWNARGRFAQTVGLLGHGGGRHRSAPAGAKATVLLEGPASTGDRIFRVRNAALVAAAERTYEDPHGSSPVPVDVAVAVVVGAPVCVTVTDKAGVTGRATGPVVEGARTKAITADEVREHVGRFGGTALAPDSWDISLSSDAGMGYSVLHKVRRQAIEDYERAALASWSDRGASDGIALPHLPRPYRYTEPAPRIVAVVSDLRTAKACLQAGCESVHLSTLEIGEDPLPAGVLPLFGRVMHEREFKAALAVADDRPRVVAATLGALGDRASAGVAVEAHWSLNVLNAYSAAELARLGARMTWLSPELSARQIAQVAADSPIPVGVAVYGRQEVMVTEHCVLMTEGPCDQRCSACKRRRGWRFLRDRKGYSFPVRTDLSGRTHIFNAVTLDVTQALPELVAAGVEAIRLDLETERADKAAAQVARVKEALALTLAGKTPPKPERSTVTSGHLFRGIR